MSQNASGKASDSSTVNVKSDSVECPTCGKSDFDSRQYMKIHHVNAHGESIAGEDVECEHCGEITRKRPHEIEDFDKNFCSDECSAQYKRENRGGENHHNYKGGKNEYECDFCGESIHRYASQTQIYKNVFCDRECHHKYQNATNQNVGKIESKWSTYECENCGCGVERLDSQVNEDENVFCGKGCKDKHHSKRMRGSDNPCWDGGEYEKYYGANWDEQRERALERDNYSCECCGVGKQEATLSVHHIHKIRYFKNQYDAPTWWQKANRLTNLVTLCFSCHGRWEGIPLRPDTNS
jgi:5-methylcytosine-specific restriction endonuclease McrA